MFLRKIHNGYLSLWEGDNNESNFADELENFEKGAKTQKHLQKSFFKNNLVLLSTAKKKKKKFSNINSNTATEVKVATEPKFLSEIKHE